MVDRGGGGMWWGVFHSVPREDFNKTHSKLMEGTPWLIRVLVPGLKAC